MIAIGTRIRQRLSTVATALAVIVFMIVVPARSAAAAGDDKIILGQTPPMLAWIHLQDSRGIDMWNFELSLDRGGFTSPTKVFWSSITDGCWGAYRSWCALSLWFIDWVMSFKWVSIIATPLLSIGNAMQRVISDIGVVPTFLTMTALMAGLWMLKGRSSTAVWEVGIACVIASLASGVFAQPVQMVAGPNGYVIGAARSGQALAAEISSEGAAGKTPEQLRNAQTGQLVDTFIRQPTELINFGRIIDGTRCEGAYNDVVREGPYGEDDDIRDAVKDCDEAAGDYAAHPNAAMAVGSVLFMPAAFVVLVLAMILGGAVITAAVRAMYQSVKSIVTFVTGLLPGGGRGSLMLTVAETLIALVIIVFASVFMSIFLLVIQALFSSESGDSVPQTFVIADILIVAGLVVFWRQHKQLKRLSHRMAQGMARRPGGAPATHMPERQAMSFAAGATAMRAVTDLATMRRGRAAPAVGGGPTFVDQRQQLLVIGAMPPNGSGAVDGGFLRAQPAGGGDRLGLPGGRKQLPPGPDGPALPSGPDAPGLPPGPNQPQPLPATSARMERVKASKTRKLVGALARAGTNAALAYATGGASTAIKRTAKAASVLSTARRTALRSQMSPVSEGRTHRSHGAPTTPRRPPAPSEVSGHGPSGGRKPIAYRPATGKGDRVPAGKTIVVEGKTVKHVPVVPQRPVPAPPPAADVDRAAQLRARLVDRQASGRRPGGR